MKICAVMRILRFQDGSVHMLPITFTETKAEADRIAAERNSGIGEVSGWPVVSPNGGMAGPVGQMFAGLGIVAIQFGAAEITTPSPIVTPDKGGIILPH